MEVDCGFQAVDFGGLVVDSGGFRWIPVDCGFQAVDFGGLVVDSGGFRWIPVDCCYLPVIYLLGHWYETK